MVALRNVAKARAVQEFSAAEPGSGSAEPLGSADDSHRLLKLSALLKVLGFRLAVEARSTLSGVWFDFIHLVEQAASHVALGDGIPFCLEAGEACSPLSTPETEAAVADDWRRQRRTGALWGLDDCADHDPLHSSDAAVPSAPPAANSAPTSKSSSSSSSWWIFSRSSARSTNERRSS